MGYRLASYLMGYCYHNGSEILKDRSKLLNGIWNSSAETIYLVAKCYRDGIGTDKNLDEATKWFKEYLIGSH